MNDGKTPKSLVPLPPSGGNTVSITIRDNASLYAAYMPFVKNGGFFIPTSKNYKLGDEIDLRLNFLQNNTKIDAKGRVVWITPVNSRGKRLSGVGVQFRDDDKGNARSQIENMLAQLLKSERVTHTM